MTASSKLSIYSSALLLTCSGGPLFAADIADVEAALGGGNGVYLDGGSDGNQNGGITSVWSSSTLWSTGGAAFGEDSSNSDITVGGDVLDGHHSNPDEGEITVQVSGLQAGMAYDVHVVHVGRQGDGRNNGFRWGLVSGSLDFYGNNLHPGVLLDTSPADGAELKGVSVGRAIADGSGNLTMYFDDLTNELGTISRSQIDGILLEFAGDPRIAAVEEKLGGGNGVYLDGGSDGNQNGGITSAWSSSTLWSTGGAAFGEDSSNSDITVGGDVLDGHHSNPDEGEITVQVSGLQAGMAYDVHVVHVGRQGDGRNNGFRWGLVSGSLDFYGNNLHPGVLLDTSPADGAQLKGVSVGQAIADGSGNLTMYFDDLTNELGTVSRSQIDGILLELAGDMDDDGLPDAWELAHGLSYDPENGGDGADGWAGDPDGDGYSNHEEFYLRTDPSAADDLSGMLARHVWDGVSGGTVGDLLASGVLGGPARATDLFNGFDVPQNQGDTYGQRLRGWITPAVSGNYTFWVAGDDAVQLFLSTDGSKYGRELVAFAPAATGVGEWDRFASQRSAEITLVAGERCFVEVLHKESISADHLSVRWQLSGGPREVIPPGAIQPYGGEADDRDRDEMPDGWELSVFGDLSEAGEDNPDGDLAPNWEEFLYGTDPLEADPNVGYWQLERWHEMSYYTVGELVGDRGFYGDAAAVLDARLPLSVFRERFSGSRMRGYLQVDESGWYRFWVTGRTSTELYLSPDDTPYMKERIARLGPEIGSSSGISFQDGNLWDQRTSQMSEPVHLEAGLNYYLEALQQAGHESDAHLQIAMARSDGERTLVPFEFMRSFLPLANDADDDSLPDDWEQSHGLDPTDNGYGDIDKEGERGDHDLDGLTNREEYVFGTDPTLADTDGDGLNDADEIRSYGTNPAVSDTSPESVVATISPTGVAGLGDSWIQTGGGVLTSSFRGEGSWDFSVPSDGHWVLQLEGQLRGDLRLEDILPVHVSIDGNLVERTQMVFRGSQPGSIRILSPRLTAGNHQLGIFIDNYTARRSLEVTSIRVIEPGGVDSDSNGSPDWVDRKLAERSHVFGHALYSHVSPAFVEGLAPSPSLADLTVITRSGEANRKQRYNVDQWNGMLPGFQNRLNSYETNLQQQMRAGHGRMEGFQIPHAPGPGHHKWFSKIELSRNEAIGYVAQFENLGIAENGIIVWQPYNVMDGGTMTIPVGSKLLLGVWVQDWDWQTVTLTVDGQSHSFPAAETHVELFDTAGTYQLSCAHPGGQTGSMTVIVGDADLQPDLVLCEQRLRTVELPGVGAGLTLDSGGEIRFHGLHGLSSGGSSTTMGGLFPGVHRTAARLSETEAILDQETINVVGVSDALRNSSDLYSPQGDDVFLVRSPLLITHLPDDGAYVKITVFAGGVTFADGTTVKQIDNDDLDENGVITLELLVPAERIGAPCHYIDVFDKDDIRIWNSTN